MMTRHVFLIGMPGSGKSALGRRAAALLRVPCFDTDQRIEEAAGCTVSEFFQRWGEEAFRSAEKALLEELVGEQPSLISTGGGMVTRRENRQLMRAHGYLILIDRPLQDILRDIRLETRPLLAGKGQDGVRQLYERRIGLYRQAADLTLDNSHGLQRAVSDLESMIRWLFPDM